MGNGSKIFEISDENKLKFSEDKHSVPSTPATKMRFLLIRDISLIDADMRHQPRWQVMPLRLLTHNVSLS